jgi:Fic family protein
MDSYAEIKALWKSYNITTVSDLDKYLDNFRILFAYNSGKIENSEITFHDTREIFENGRIINFTGNPRTIFELENQKKCYEVLKEKIICKNPLSILAIKEIHAILTAGTYDERRYIVNGERAGEFKKHDYITGRYEVGSLAENVESDLDDLLEEVNGYDGDNHLNVAAYFHAKFEYIHPFADGNGRVGRTLLNYHLMINDTPPLIIYDEDKSGYYAALENYDANEEIVPLYEFLKQLTVKTWHKTIELKHL